MQQWVRTFRHTCSGWYSSATGVVWSYRRRQAHAPPRDILGPKSTHWNTHWNDKDVYLSVNVESGTILSGATGPYEATDFSRSILAE